MWLAHLKPKSFARPEGFVPPLAGSDARHVFVEKIGTVSFHHHDPYAQCFSKIVRGFDRDLADARSLVASGLLMLPLIVEPALLELVGAVPSRAYARYPALTRDAVLAAVEDFVRTD